MDLPKNAFKRALPEGRTQIGLWSCLSSHYTVEVIAGAGYDWLLLDMEHSPNDLEWMLAAGAQFVAVGADAGLLARGAENLLARFRQ